MSHTFRLNSNTFTGIYDGKIHFFGNFLSKDQKQSLLMRKDGIFELYKEDVAIDSTRLDMLSVSSSEQLNLDSLFDNINKKLGPVSNKPLKERYNSFAKEFEGMAKDGQFQFTVNGTYLKGVQIVIEIPSEQSGGKYKKSRKVKKTKKRSHKKRGGSRKKTKKSRKSRKH